MDAQYDCNPMPTSSHNHTFLNGPRLDQQKKEIMWTEEVFG